MLPGKKYKPEDILQIGWRWKFLIIVPFIAVSIGTVIVSRLLPDMYRSSTTIMVVPQKVPEAYVRSTVTTRFEDRLQTIGQQIMSRPRLERLILDNNLYPRERRRGIMEDVVQRMRDDISVSPIRGAEAFSVSYVSQDPRVAMHITEALATMFMDESRTDRSVTAEATTDFLQNQLEDARRQLTDTEQKLAEYKRRHSGELPSERDANLQVLNNTQLQVQQVVESINRDRDQRYLIEKAQRELEAQASQPPAAVTLPSDDPSAVPAGSAAAALEYAKAQLRAMQLRYTDSHPEIKRMKGIVADLEKKAAAEALEKPLSPDTGGEAAALTPEQKARQNTMTGLKLELEALDRRIQTKLAQEQDLRQKISVYQARVEATPTRESELTSLTRDYDTLLKNYQSLLAKQEDSKVAANLERREIGEQFRTIEPPRIPEKPFSPNRPLINLLGSLGGLGLGLGLTALVEYRDRSFRTDDEVVSVLSLPVLAMIPMMKTRAERRKEKRRRVRVLVAGVATFAIAAAVLVWRFDLIRRFMP